MISKLLHLFYSPYGYFSNSQKCHLEFSKLAKIVETKGFKVLQNVKTRWINMLTPLKWVKKKYKTLIIKMATNNGSMETTKAICEFV
jgi:hypothetical protein